MGAAIFYNAEQSLIKLWFVLKFTAEQQIFYVVGVNNS